MYAGRVAEIGPVHNVIHAAGGRILRPALMACDSRHGERHASA